MGRTRSTSTKGNEYLRAFTHGSTCSLIPYFENETLMGLSIHLYGPIAALPSCNTKDIGKRYVTNKRTGRRTLVPLQRKSDRQLAYLSALTSLYAAELLKNQVYPPPTFGDRLVTLTLIASEAGRRGRWDSSNLIKFLSDWLEDVGLVEDDHRVEAHGYKATEYGREDGVTRIYVTDRAITQRLHTRIIDETERCFFGDRALGRAEPRTHGEISRDQARDRGTWMRDL